MIKYERIKIGLTQFSNPTAGQARRGLKQCWTDAYGAKKEKAKQCGI